MREQLFRQLERHTEAIICRLRGASTSSVLKWAAHELWLLSTKGITATGLSSPAKQVFHLLGLMLATPAVDPHDLDERGWRSLKKEIEGAFRQYTRMYFPTRAEIVRSGPKWAKIRQVAMNVYLDRMNTYPLLNRTQLIERAHELCDGFDAVVLSELGLSTAKVMEMCDWVWRNQEDRLNAIGALLGEAAIEWEQWKKSGEGLDQARDRIAGGPRADLGKKLTEAMQLQNVVDEDAMRAVFGSERVALLNRHFASERGAAARFRLPGDANPAEERPLMRDEFNRLICPNPLMVLLAALARLDGILRASDQREAYLRNRDKVVAAKSAALLRAFLGPEALVLEGVYRGPDGRDENDVLARIDADYLAVEAKAKRSRMPPRDSDMAFAKIEQDFRHEGGIQGGFEQAKALRRYLLAPGSKNLFNRGGRAILSVDQPPRDVIPIVVTWDSWGALATDLTMMLQRAAEESLPWVVSIDQFELALEGFRHDGKTAADFLRFLRERQRVHGHVHTADELEVVGVFLENDGFPPQFTAENTVVMLTAESARIFDRIEAEKRGVELPPRKPLQLWDVGSKIRELLQKARSAGKKRG